MYEGKKYNRENGEVNNKINRGATLVYGICFSYFSYYLVSSWYARKHPMLILFFVHNPDCSSLLRRK